MKIGAVLGALITIAVVFTYGFFGLLAAWSGVWVPSGPDDYGNTCLFALLKKYARFAHSMAWRAFLLGTIAAVLQCVVAPPWRVPLHTSSLHDGVVNHH